MKPPVGSRWEYEGGFGSHRVEVLAEPFQFDGTWWVPCHNPGVGVVGVPQCIDLARFDHATRLDAIEPPPGQLALDDDPPPDTPKARAGDPATSRLAALRNEPRRGTQRHTLLAAYRSHPGGLTAEQAARATCLAYVSASTRITELERGGHLVEKRQGNGPARRDTEAGGTARVLVAREHARAAA